MVNFVRPEDFGAIAHENFNSTEAFKQAIQVAIMCQLPIYLSKGTYLITAPINCYGVVPSIPDAKVVGVNIIGRGRKFSTIKFASSTPQDALLFHSDRMYGRYGSLKDLHITCESGSALSLLSLKNWSEFTMENIEINGASEANLKVEGHQYFTARGCFFYLSENHAAVIGKDTLNGLPGTTACFYNCLFDRAQNWACQIRYGVSDTTFYNCTFQSSGLGTGNGGGLELWDGNITLTAPFFEDNGGFDAHFGSKGTTKFGARAVVVQPRLSGPNPKKANSGGLFFQRSAGIVEGGYFGNSINYPIVLDTEADVKLLSYPDEAPRAVTANLQEIVNRSFEGSILQTRRFYKDSDYPAHRILPGETVSISCEIEFQGALGEEFQYPQLGDIVNVGYNFPVPGLLVSGFVSRACTSGIDAEVTVTILNASPDPLTLPAASMKIEVLRN